MTSPDPVFEPPASPPSRQPAPLTLEHLGELLESFSIPVEPRFGDPVPPEAYNPVVECPFGHTTGQSVLDPGPATDEEELLRRDVAGVVLDLLDLSKPDAERAEALRRLVHSDPLRALSLLAHLVTNTWEINEIAEGLEPGSYLAGLRAAYEADCRDGAQPK